MCMCMYMYIYIYIYIYILLQMFECLILLGLDLQASGRGTWLGVTKTGRLAALTNYRGSCRNVLKSRGSVSARVEYRV